LLTIPYSVSRPDARTQRSRSVSWAFFRRFPKLIPVGALIYILLFFANSEFVMANDDRAMLQTQLKQLQAATKVVLMVIPRGVAFNVRIDEQMLPKVACVYYTDSGSISRTILNIINNGIVDYRKGNKEHFEIRIGLIFKDRNDTMQEFYFEDWGGRHDVRGVSGDYRILGKADLPDQLRALLTHRDVVLIRDRGSTCPRS
jgi:hypothetical protein